MAGQENKVQFNLKNVHYAPMTTTEGSPTWATPVKVPGAVSLALEQQGEITKFYADGIVYWQAASNNGYQGDLEMAMFPDQMRIDIWKMEKTETDNVMVENAFSKPVPFALLFQIDGDNEDRLYCLYNCSATRPSVGGQTTTETKEPQTQSCTISATPLENGNIMAKTCADTEPTVITNWFTKVYEKAEA